MFANGVDTECFSSSNLINQFDKFQECFPEEIWRLDIQRKYIRTFTGESIDNSKPKNDVQYLRDMMQGRKKYQRRQWVKDQEFYFGTKNLMNTVVGDNNRITFRCFTPTGSDVVVQPNYTLNIVPYSDMYVSVMFGNGNTVQVRAKGGENYTIDCPLSTMDDTQVTIYGANRISALNDLSACYIAANNFSMATRLRKLVLGNTTQGYNNTRLVSLTLGNNKLLEELDIRNCGNLTGSINLSNCSNLLKLYAEGTSVSGVTFATNGKVQIAHLPSTVNTLIMRNLNNLSDFSCTLSQLENLTLEGGSLNSLEIVGRCINTLKTLYLYNIDWTVNNTELTNKILVLFYSILTGKLYIGGTVRYSELNNYLNKWTDLEISYDQSSYVNQFPVNFINYDGQTLKSVYTDQGGLIDQTQVPSPTRDSDAQYDYTFDCWTLSDGTTVNLNTQRISSEINLYAKYSTSIRSYTVKWYSYGNNVLETQTVNYGASATYSGDDPSRTDGESSYIYYLFDGWDNHTGYIAGDLDVHAKWQASNGLPNATTPTKQLTAAQVYGLVQSGELANRFDDGDEISVQFGYLPEFNNVQMIDIVKQETEINGSTYIDTNVKPFENIQEGWTMVIDFRVNEYSTNNLTLLSCYDMDGSNGIELFTNSSSVYARINTDTSVRASYANYRGLIVLRHTPNENYVRTYVMDANSDYWAADNITYTLSSFSNTLRNINSTLILGARRDNTDGSISRYGSGTIYKLRLYKADLGDTICRKMASWTNEVNTFQYFGTRKYRHETTGYTSGSFIQKGLFEKVHMMNKTNTNTGGWDASYMRTYLNTRILNAIEQKWRFIIKPVRVKALDGGTTQAIKTSIDKIYLPCNTEVGGNTSSPYQDEMTNQDYQDRISWFTSNASRLKWRGREIDMSTVKVFSSKTDPTIDQSSNNVKLGDVWINSDGHGFVLEKTSKKPFTSETTSASNLSGYTWVRAWYWWERTAYPGSSTYFMNVGNGGYPYNYGSAAYNVGVACAFSV